MLNVRRKTGLRLCEVAMNARRCYSFSEKLYCYSERMLNGQVHDFKRKEVTMKDRFCPIKAFQMEEAVVKAREKTKKLPFG